MSKQKAKWKEILLLHNTLHNGNHLEIQSSLVNRITYQVNLIILMFKSL